MLNTKTLYYKKEHNFMFKSFMKVNCHLFHTPCLPSIRHCHSFLSFIQVNNLNVIE